jgi:hypothetical protein
VLWARLRDAAVLKTVYAYGTRRTESSRVGLVDVRRNAKMPVFGKYGSVMVRCGKTVEGAPPKRRTVLTVPEMDWVTDTLDHWLTEPDQARGGQRPGPQDGGGGRGPDSDEPAPDRG